MFIFIIFFVKLLQMTLNRGSNNFKGVLSHLLINYLIRQAKTPHGRFETHGIKIIKVPEGFENITS